jgi:hypothetical protein
MSITPSTTLYRSRGHAYETLGDFEHALSDYKRALEIARSMQEGVAEWQSVVDLGFLWSERNYVNDGYFFV